MAREVAPLLTREEEELAAKQDELAAQEAQLVEAELSLASHKAELAAFRGLYLRRVGVLYAELDEWKARLAEIRAEQAATPELKSKAAEARAQAEESHSEAYSEAAEVQAFAPSEKLKRLYREAAAQVHQGPGADELDRIRSERLIGEANAAYTACDEDWLQRILAGLKTDPMAVRRNGNSADLILPQVKLNQYQVSRAAIEHELASLKASEIALLRQDVQGPQQEARDLLSEIAAVVREQIAETKKEFDDQSQKASPNLKSQCIKERPNPLAPDTEPLCIAKVKLNGKWGYLGTDGRFIVHPSFGCLGEFSCGRASFSYSSDYGEGTWGYLNLDGEEVIARQFGPASTIPKGLVNWDFVDGLALVLFEGRFGYIAMDGAFAVKPVYEDARPFFKGAAPVKLNGKFCFIDKSGKRIGNACDYIDHWQTFRSKEEVVPAQLEKKWGFINYRGDFIIEPVYDRIEATECGNIWSAFSGENIDLLDNRGNIASHLIRDQYWGDVICYDPEEKLIEIEQCYSTSDESPGRLILNEDGNHIACEGDCRKIGIFRDGACPVFEREDSYYINKRGERITEASLQAVGDFRFGKGIVRREGLYGYIDSKGNLLTPARFKYAHGFLDQYAQVLTLGGEWIWINSSGDAVAAPLFKENGKCGLGLEAWPFQRPEQGWSTSREFREGFCRVELDGRYGFVDTGCRVVVEPRFDEVRDFSGGVAAVKDTSGKWGYVNTDGDVITVPRFDEVRDFTDELAAVKDDRGKWGYVDKAGEITVEPQFDAVGYFSSGLAAVKVVSGKWGYMNTVGEIVISPEYEYAGYFRPIKR